MKLGGGEGGGGCSGWKSGACGPLNCRLHHARCWPTSQHVCIGLSRARARAVPCLPGWRVSQVAMVHAKWQSLTRWRENWRACGYFQFPGPFHPTRRMFWWRQDLRVSSLRDLVSSHPLISKPLIPGRPFWRLLEGRTTYNVDGRRGVLSRSLLLLGVRYSRRGVLSRSLLLLGVRCSRRTVWREKIF